MWQAVVAMIPIAIAGVAFFGMPALQVMAISVASAWAFDLLGCRLNGRSMNLTDASPIVTGLLLGFMLPPTAPWYVPAVGALYAIVIGKQLFGGLGNNLFNPVLVGRVLLQWTYPESLNLTEYPMPFDVVTSATPLSATTAAHQARLMQLILGTRAGCIGETSALLIMLSGAYLIYLRAIDWKVPALCLISVFALSLLLPAPDKFAGHAPYLVHNPLYHTLSGGVVLAAFLLVTDPVTTPLTAAGRAIFAIGVGLITVLIRYYGIYPEGVAYAILIMNGLTPLINRVLYPKPFGHP